jgi:hypothetical protein
MYKKTRVIHSSNTEKEEMEVLEEKEESEKEEEARQLEVEDTCV